MKFPKEEMSSEFAEYKTKMNSLIEFFKLNNIGPADAVSIAMIFIAHSAKLYFDEDEINSIFKLTVKLVYRDKG